MDVKQHFNNNSNDKVIYIYIYIERERDRERQREGERGREREISNARPSQFVQIWRTLHALQDDQQGANIHTSTDAYNSEQ